MSYSERKNIREQRTTLFCAFISSWLSGELLRDDEFCLAGHGIQHSLLLGLRTSSVEWSGHYCEPSVLCSPGLNKKL